MDLVTQTVLGAAVGEVVLGKKAGNKAIMWGAVGGVIPDLDILVTPFFNEVDGLFVHRGFSHSILFAFLLAPPLAWLVHRIHRKRLNISRMQWMKLLFWAAFTHPILDYFTTYGTGAFEPFSGYRVEFGTIAIVDVFYTVPIILVLLVIMFMKLAAVSRRKLILSTVALTSVYLLGTVGNKIYVNAVFRDAFEAQNMEYKQYKTTPLPLTNFLWMGMAKTDNGYYMALFSNFDDHAPADFTFIPKNEERLAAISEDENLKQLIKFTKGYYHVNEDENGLYLADLRFGKMGLDEDADFVFKFYIRGTEGDLEITRSTESRKIENDAFSAFIYRIRGKKKGVSANTNNP